MEHRLHPCAYRGPERPLPRLECSMALSLTYLLRIPIQICDTYMPRFPTLAREATVIYVLHDGQLRLPFAPAATLWEAVEMEAGGDDLYGDTGWIDNSDYFYETGPYDG